MKKIEFGFNDDNRLNGQWGSIEFYNGEYLDVFSYDQMDFLVTRIVDSAKGLDGSIDVREIAQDYYSDGSYITYGNKLKNASCLKFQELLNQRKMIEAINEGKSIINLLRDTGISVHMSYLHDVTSKSETVPAVLTSVKPEVFGRLKASKRECHGRSMYDLTNEIRRLQAELKKRMATEEPKVTENNFTR